MFRLSRFPERNPQKQLANSRAGREERGIGNLNFLRDLNKKFDDGFLSGDATAVAALYAQDAVIVSPDPEPIHGRDAIEKHWADVFKKVHFSKHARTLDQTADNGLWMTGNWDATFRVENGSALKVNGHYLNILVREGDALKFQVETYNAAGPPVPAETK